MRPRPPVVTDLARRCSALLEHAAHLYPLLAEQAGQSAAGRNTDNDGQPRAIGGVSDPTGTTAMSEVCSRCRGCGRRTYHELCPECGNGDKHPVGQCVKCRYTGRITLTGPEACNKCNGSGWEPTESVLEERALSAFWDVLNKVVLAVEGMEQRMPEASLQLRTLNSAIASGKQKRKGERFVSQKQANGYKCRACEAIVPRLKHGLCVAYAAEVARRDPVTGKYMPSPESLANNCYDRWTGDYAREGINAVDWALREGVKRRTSA